MLPLVPCADRLSRLIPVRLSLFLLALAGLLIPAAHASICTVTSTVDSTDPGTLRTCLTTVNAGDTIQFGVTGTVTLTSALPQITQNLTIYGSGPAVLTISGADSYPVFNIASSATVTINGMTIANGNGTNGGGISNAGTLTVENGAFTSNLAQSSGGAIASSGTLTVYGVSFFGNGSNSFGGAIYNSDSGALTVSNSTFSGNRSSLGGAIAGGNGLVMVVESTFSANAAVDSGGAIYGGAFLALINSTFSGNSADGQGGAIYTGTGQTAPYNSIFTGNVAPTGGGIYNSGTLNGRNNILGADIGGECGGTGTGCFTNGTNGNQVGVPASSIRLLPLGNYGGTIQTMALLPGSAAICAGLKADAFDANSNPLIFDERGFAMDPTCASSSVDIGAVQTNQYVVNSLIDTGDGSDNCNPLGTGTTCSLRDAIGDANTSGGDVTFLPTLTSAANPGTINLSALAGGNGNTLTLSAVNILGPGANQLSIAGDDDTNLGSVLAVNSGAQAFLYGLTITQGYTRNSPGGGGIYNQGTLTLMTSAISGNLTDSGASGAGIYNDGTLTLTNSSVSGNQIISGSGSGGGIYSTGTLTLTESTVGGNSIPFQSFGGGGGIFIAVGSATLSASTISANTAAQFCPPVPNAPCMGGAGGGIYSGGTLTLTNSILAGNSGQGGANSGDCAGSCPSNGDSNVVGGTPQLSSPQSNGPDTTVSTMIPFPGSPAICAGLLSNIPTGVTTDQRGYPNLNSTYPGYSSEAPCVDAGAVQTNYAIAFTTQPPTAFVTGRPLSPAPVVTLTENGNPAAAANSAVTMTDADSGLSGGTNSETFSSPTATFSNLIFTSAETGDTLTATLSLNPSLTTPLSLVTQAGTAVDVIPAADLAILTTPTPGLSTVLGATNVAFQWTAGTGATNYQLNLSTIAPGAREVYSFKGNANSASAATLAANGQYVYARLYTKVNGDWVYNDYQYTESGTPVPASLISPTPGPSTTVGASNVTFQWNFGTGISLYQLALSATTPGASDLFSYKGTNTYVTVPTLPANGVPFYARLYSLINGTWQYNDYVYTEGGSPRAVLTSPTPGLSTVLGTSNVTFNWTTGTDVYVYQLNVGTTAPGSSDLFVYKGNATTTAATTLPSNGVTVYARLYSYYNGAWQYNDYVYTESGTATPAVLTSPSPGVGTVLGTTDVTFQWTAGTGVTDYQLNLSAAAPGESDLFLYKGTATSATATTLPANGVTVYARLYSKIDGAWQYNDYVYTEQ
jgi:predicted outer membrane repeat protein